MDPDASYEEATQALRPGDTLVAIHRRAHRAGDSIVDVLKEFVATLGPALRTDGQELTAAVQADQILANAVSDTEDDACRWAVAFAETRDARETREARINIWSRASAHWIVTPYIVDRIPHTGCNNPQ